MALKTLSALPVFADSLFADRFNRIDRLFQPVNGRYAGGHFTGL